MSIRFASNDRNQAAGAECTIECVDDATTTTTSTTTTTTTITTTTTRNTTTKPGDINYQALKAGKSSI